MDLIARNHSVLIPNAPLSLQIFSWTALLLREILYYELFLDLPAHSQAFLVGEVRRKHIGDLFIVNLQEGAFDYTICCSVREYLGYWCWDDPFIVRITFEGKGLACAGLSISKNCCIVPFNKLAHEFFKATVLIDGVFGDIGVMNHIYLDCFALVPWHFQNNLPLSSQWDQVLWCLDGLHLDGHSNTCVLYHFIINKSNIGVSLLDYTQEKIMWILISVSSEIVLLYELFSLLGIV